MCLEQNISIGSHWIRTFDAPFHHFSQWRIQDFPEEGAPTLQGGRQYTILPNFPKNCMKLKEFGPRGGGARPKFYYVDPPLFHNVSMYLHEMATKASNDPALL